MMVPDEVNKYARSLQITQSEVQRIEDKVDDIDKSLENIKKSNEILFDTVKTLEDKIDKIVYGTEQAEQSHQTMIAKSNQVNPKTISLISAIFVIIEVIKVYFHV